MGVIRTYFRMHRWQRRILLLLLTLIVSCLVGWGGMLVYWNYKVVTALGKGSTAERGIARERAYQLSLLWDSTQWALLHTLDTPNDKRFLDITEVLDRLGVFESARVAPRWRDRRNQVYFFSLQPTEHELSTNSYDPHVETRAQLLREFILAARWNPYTETVLRAAQSDPDPTVRRIAAVLAGIHKRSDVLRVMLHDQNPQVLSAAAWNIALANLPDMQSTLLTAWTEITASLVASSSQPTSAPAEPPSTQPVEPQQQAKAEAMASLAIAIHRLGGNILPDIAAILAEVPDGTTREYLYYVLGQAEANAAADLVKQELARMQKGQSPSPLLLVAAARHAPTEAEPFARTILAQAGQPDPPAGLLESHVLAALTVANATEMDTTQELLALLDQQWGPDRPILLRETVFALGRQLPANNPALRQTAIDLLQNAALYEFMPPDADGVAEMVTTPQPSAAAAAAYWLAEPADTQVEFKTLDADAGTVEMILPKNAAFFAREVAASSDPIAGDVLAWHIGRSGQAEAFRLGKTLLRGPAKGLAEHDPHVRVTGAMLLAFSARTPEQKQDALEWIRTQLDREAYLSRVTMQGAMAILDPDESAALLRTLVLTNNAPLRRGLTLLLAAGRQDVLDSLFWGGLWPDARLNRLLVTENFYEVLDAYSPGLCRPTSSAGAEMRLWQIDRLRMEYAHRRMAIPAPSRKEPAK